MIPKPTKKKKVKKGVSDGKRFQRIKMKLSVDWFNFKHNFFWTMHLMILLFGLLCSIAAIILCIIAMGI